MMAPTLAGVLGTLAVLTLSVGSAEARELRVAIDGIGQISGSPYSSLVRPETYLSSAIFDGLTRFDKSGRLVPALATNWRQEGPTSWRFNLRRGVVFSNGEPFDADAVVATLDWIKSEAGAGTAAAADVSDVAAVEAEDQNTVVVQTSRPDPILPQRLAAVMIAAPHAWAELGVEGFAAHPAGTGAFTLAGATAESITLAANSTSWRKPILDRIVLQNLPALQTKALLDGKIDVATAVEIDDIATIQDRGLLVTTSPAAAVAAIALRRDDTMPALRDIRVRQALNYAVDKSAIGDLILHGLGHAAGQPAARQVTGYNPDVEPYPFDVAKARALLAEANVGPGLSLRVDAALDRTPADRAIVEALVAQMAAIGITLELHPVDADVAANEAAAGWNTDTDGLLISFSALPLNDMIQPLILFSCGGAPRILCNPLLSSAIAAAESDLDGPRRLARLGDLAKKLHDDPPAIYLNELFDVFALSRKVEGFSVVNRVPVYESIGLRP